MKKNIILTSVILGMSAASVLFTGCNKPTERPSVVDSDIAANLVELKDVGEITSDKKIVYSANGKADIASFAGSLKQVKLEGKVADLIKKVKTEATKKAIEDQLEKGAIAIVVLNDQIKILNVVSQTSSNFDMQVTSLNYLSALKALSKTSEAAAQASIVTQLETLRYKSPADLKQTFGLAEVTALKVEQHGNLENDRNDYNERKSILKVMARPFEVSTHIVVGEEIGSEAEAAAEKAKAEKAAKAALKGE